MVVVGNKKVLSTAKLGATTMVINTAILPGDFTRNADFSLPTERLKRAIRTAAGAEKSNFVDATRLATALLGNSIGANIFIVGYAYQLGSLPLSAGIDRARDRTQRRSGADRIWPRSSSGAAPRSISPLSRR